MRTSLNPLNQVYVFNYKSAKPTNADQPYKGFNPLNQVYVFNFRLSYEVFWRFEF